jgi:hypothetical protein
MIAQLRAVGSDALELAKQTVISFAVGPNPERGGQLEATV